MSFFSAIVEFFCGMSPSAFTIETADGTIFIYRGSTLVGTADQVTFEKEFRDGRGYGFIDAHVLGLDLPAAELTVLRDMWRTWGHANQEKRDDPDPG